MELMEKNLLGDVMVDVSMLKKNAIQERLDRELTIKDIEKIQKKLKKLLNYLN